MALFYPTLYRRRITDLTSADLRTLGVSGLLLDVDNTLTTHDCPELEPGGNWHGLPPCRRPAST